MTPVQTAIAYELHQRASGVTRDARMLVKAGDVIELLNALRTAERDGDAADAQLQRALIEHAEERAKRLLIANYDLGSLAASSSEPAG